MGQEIIRIYECTKCDYGTTTTQKLSKCKMCGAELKLLNQFSINPDNSLKAINKSEEYKKEMAVQNAERAKKKQEEQRMQEYLQQRSHQPNVPHCPTCGSTNVQKISGMKRWLSVGLFGLASSDVGKTMVCKKCGYKFWDESDIVALRDSILSL